MTVGTEIRRRRKALKWTLEELAHRIGTDTGNLSRLETGKQGYSDEMLHRIADALGCSVSELFAAQEGISNIAASSIGSRRIPLLNYVQAGAMREIADQPWAGEYLLADHDIGSNAFALEIRGESMLPEFKEGDRVIVDPDVRPQPGDFVVAKNGGDEATFKKYRPRGVNEQGEEVFELVPLNEDYPSMRSDVTPLLIIGTMVEHRKYRKR